MAIPLFQELISKALHIASFIAEMEESVNILTDTCCAKQSEF
jgi:hypothetical protein